jgi:hypothetical protein
MTAGRNNPAPRRVRTGASTSETTSAEGSRYRSMHDLLELLDWKRRIFALYAEVRAAADPVVGWRRWRDVRAELYAGHPQSPRLGASPRYFDYDASLRAVATVVASEPTSFRIPGSAGSETAFTRFAHARFELRGEPQELELYWLDAYGGGIFLPFGDETNGAETYGAGRYLLDTVKGADLGGDDGELVLDFNFAFSPSCAYSDRWACPLAPPANRLPLAAEGGELTPA